MTALVLAAFMAAEKSLIPLTTNEYFNAQCHLEAAGFSVNCVDGAWGLKSRRAKELYEKSGHTLPKTKFPLKYETVTQADINELVEIPEDPEEKADLEYFGYESIKEMFAERGHVSRKCLEKLNPDIKDWGKLKAGDKIRIPAFTPMYEESSPTGKAAIVKISLSRCEVICLDKNGKPLAFFPCSIAASKSKLPPHGEVKIVAHIENPNYTYTPDPPDPSIMTLESEPQDAKSGSHVKRHIFEPGPNNPVGLAWIGLDLPGYGIHGTPYPERVGNAESHGCFRLANWNALRLYRLTDFNTKVLIVP